MRSGPGGAEVLVGDDDSGHEVHVVRDIGRAAVLADEPHVLRSDEERDRRLGRRQVGMRRRVDGFEDLAAPAELDPVGRGLDDRAVQDVGNPHDPGHRLRGRLPQQLGARRRLHDAPAVVDHDAVTQPIGLGEVVGDHHRRGAHRAQDLAQLVAQRAAQRRVERGQRLVQQQQRRLDGQRAPQRHPLALATRELTWIALLEATQAELLDHPRHSARALGAGAIPQAEAEIVRHGEVREERVALEHVADAPGLRGKIDPGRAVEEDAPVDDDAPRRRGDQPGQTRQRQRLARSRRPEEHGHPAARRPRHVEIEARHLQRDGDLEAIAHVALAPSRLAATITRQDSAVRTPTSSSAVGSSPVWTAV